MALAQKHVPSLINVRRPLRWQDAYTSVTLGQRSITPERTEVRQVEGMRHVEGVLHDELENAVTTRYIR